MKKILIVVDMQNDFVSGVLGTAEAQAIVPKVDNLIETGEFDEVYYTFDTHYDPEYFSTLEGKKLPAAHCINGTNGWNLAIKNGPIDANHSITKTRFGYPYWDGVFDDLCITDKDTITIVGLCTDICVVSNALILKAEFPNTPIICDASCCAGTTPEAHKAALTVMKSCQIDIIND